MRTKTKIQLVALMILIVLNAGCGSGDGGSSGPEVGDSGSECGSSTRYYPVKVGNSWTYDNDLNYAIVPSKAQIIECHDNKFTLESLKKGNDQDWRRQGLTEYELTSLGWAVTKTTKYDSFGNPDFVYEYSPYALVLPIDLDVGDSIATDYTYTTYRRDQNGNLTMEYSAHVKKVITAEAIETVAVPAGTFNNVLKLKKDYDPGEYFYDWYGEGVGHVKSTNSELTEFNLVE